MKLLFYSSMEMDASSAGRSLGRDDRRGIPSAAVAQSRPRALKEAVALSRASRRSGDGEGSPRPARGKARYVRAPRQLSGPCPPLRLAARRPRAAAGRAPQRVRERRAASRLPPADRARAGRDRQVAPRPGVRRTSSATEATVLHGHCLPYGEGITYWPLTEVVREILRSEGSSGAESSSAAIAELLPGEDKADLIGELIFEALGLGSGGAGTGEVTSWAVRKLFEATRAAPPARDRVRRPAVGRADVPRRSSSTWPSSRATRRSCCSAWRGPSSSTAIPPGRGGKLDAASMLLEPLDDGDCRTLIANLLGRGPLPADAATRIAEAADGNALFAEELLAMLVDDDLLDLGRRPLGGGRRPPRRAGAARRSTRCSPPGSRACPATSAHCSCWRRSRATIFHRSAIRELAPEVPDTFIERSLAALVRRDVIRPDHVELRRRRGVPLPASPDPRCRLPVALRRRRRAELHERLADWLERMAAGRLGEYEEIVGYHLEQAYRCRSELGSADAELRGSAHGRRSGSSWPGAARSRAATCPRRSACWSARRPLSADDMSRRAELLPELGAALIAAGRLPEADWVLGRGEAGRGARRATSGRSRACSCSCSSSRLLHVERGRQRGGRARRRAA